jgi:hypothetical protein
MHSCSVTFSLWTEGVTVLILYIFCLQKYAVTLAQQLGLKGPKYAKKLGENLDESRLGQMREDQITQLYELFLAAKEDRKEGKDDDKVS